jgi:hypothetical protein
MSRLRQSRETRRKQRIRNYRESNNTVDSDWIGYSSGTLKLNSKKVYHRQGQLASSQQGERNIRTNIITIDYPLSTLHCPLS